MSSGSSGSVPGNGDLMKNLSPHERSRLMKHIPKHQPPTSASNMHTRPFNRFASSASQKPVVPRWNSPLASDASSKANNRKSYVGPTTRSSDVEVPQLSEKNVRAFEKQLNNDKMKRQQPKPSQNPPLKPKPNFLKKTASQQEDDSSVVSEKVLKPSELLKRNKQQRRSSPLVTPAQSKQDCQLHSNSGATQQQKSFVVVHKSKPTAPSAASDKSDAVHQGGHSLSPWTRQNKDSTVTKNPPTAVVAPLRETTKPAAAQQQQQQNDKKPEVKSEGCALGEEDLMDDEEYNTFIEKDVVDDDDEELEAARMLRLSAAPPAAGTDSGGDAVGSKPKSAISESSKKKKKKAKTFHKKKNTRTDGHYFEAVELDKWMNWCDACGSFIMANLWGSSSQAQCTKCKMLVHTKCIPNVSLTCEADKNSEDSDYYNKTTTLTETTDESTLKEYNTIKRQYTRQQINEKIDQFNRTVKGGQHMVLLEDGETFRGFIRVSMMLQRPVSAQEGCKTIKHTTRQNKQSFYVEKGAMKALHLTSDTTAEKVVKALLDKFQIIDNPQKFALFERDQKEDDHVILRKMLPNERPLFLRLLWGSSRNEGKSFVLQENETREINYNNFQIPLLENFLVYLNKEEENHVKVIVDKYDRFKEQLLQIIRQREQA